MSQCGHLFCWPCIYGWIERSANEQGETTCPVCKAGLTRSRLVPLYGRGREEKDPRRQVPSRPQGVRAPEPVRRHVGFGMPGGAQVMMGMGLPFLPMVQFAPTMLGFQLNAGGGPPAFFGGGVAPGPVVAPADSAAPTAPRTPEEENNAAMEAMRQGRAQTVGKLLLFALLMIFLWLMMANSRVGFLVL